MKIKKIIKIISGSRKIEKIKIICICFWVVSLFLCKEDINSQGTNNNDSSSKYHMGFSSEIFLDINMQDAKAALKLLSSKYMQDAGLNYESQITIFNDIKMLYQNKFDLIFLLSSEYLKIKEKVDISPSTVPLFQNNVYAKFLLLVKQNSAINNLADLKNKKIIIQSNFDMESSIVFMWLDSILLKKFGERHDTFFSDIQVVQKGTKVVLPTFFNNADACIVYDYIYDTLAELNPQLKKQLTSLIISPGYSLAVACITKSPKNKEYDSILSAILNMHKDTEGKQLLTIFKVNKQIPYKEEYLESVKKLIDEFNYLNNRYSLENLTRK